MLDVYKRQGEQPGAGQAPVAGQNAVGALAAGGQAGPLQMAHGLSLIHIWHSKESKWYSPVLTRRTEDLMS